MASLTDQFTLDTLPRIADVSFENRAVVAAPKLSSATTLNVGISRSSISSYILKPTPRLLWSYALAPSMIVNCIDVVEHKSVEKFAVGFTDRKTHGILFIKKSNDKVETFTLNSNEMIISIRFSSDSDYIYTISESSTVAIYKFHTVEKTETTNGNEDDNEIEDDENEDDENEDDFKVPTHSILNKLRHTKIIHHEYLSKTQTLGVETKDGFLLLVELVNKRLQTRLVSLDLNNSIEIKSFQIQEDYLESKFAYDPEIGQLYQYILESHRLNIYLLPHFAIKQLFELSFPNTDNKNVSLLSAAPLRLLFAVDNTVYLFNVKFKAIMDKYEDDEKSQTLLLSVYYVKGNTLKTTNTFAVYVKHSKSLNKTSLNIVNVYVGFGTMSECLGKGLSSESKIHSKTQPKSNGNGKKLVDVSKVNKFKGLVNLLDDDFVNRELQAEAELQEVYNALEKAALDKNLQAWERILVPFLKGESWKSISKNDKKGSSNPSTPKKQQQKSKKKYEFQVFEVEKDRIVEYNFIYEVLSLIFQVSEKVSLKLDFLPEHTLTYLITHPLFPRIFTIGILELFEDINQLRLLRQALITCPNLGCSEVVGQLSTSNDDIFKDAVSRLVEEFSITQITDALVVEISNNANFNLQDIVKKIFILDCGWDIASAIIDAGGIFGWSPKLIESLIEDVEQQVESLNRNNYNLTLTSQALLQIKNGKASKLKKKGNENGDIVEDSKQEDQLKSMLTIKNTSRHNLLDEGISARKVPTYSIEKLIL